MTSPPLPERDGSGSAARHHHDAFISYSTQDKPVADALVARLEQAGIRCWIAPRDVVPGDIWSESIVGAIQDSRIMVVVFSSNANASRQVLREVERAMASDTVVVPFRVESTEPSGAMAYFLATEHWLDAITPPLDDHIDQLVRVARGLLNRAETDAGTGTDHVPAPAEEPVPAPQPPASPRRSSTRTALIAAGAVAGVVLAVVATVVALQPGGDPGNGAPGAVTSGSPPDGRIPAPWPTKLEAIEVGDCLGRFVSDVVADDLIVVPCGEPHEEEVFYLADAFVGDAWPPDLAYPGTDSLEGAGHGLCEPEFTAYVGVSWLDSQLLLFAHTPAKPAWDAGERWLLCLVSGEKTLEGSVKGSAK